MSQVNLNVNKYELWAQGVNPKTVQLLEDVSSVLSKFSAGMTTLPPVTTGAAGAGSLQEKLLIPVLANPLGGGVSLEQLVEALGMEERQNALKGGLASLKAKSAEIKERNEEKLKQVQEQVDKLKSKGILDGFLKAFKWIGMVLGAVASIATVALGAVTGNPLLIAGGLIGLTMTVNAIVSEATDGKVSIGAGVAAIAKKCGASEETAQWIGMGFEIVVSVLGAGLSIGGAIGAIGSTATAVTNMISKVTLAVNIASGLNLAAKGSAQIANAVFDYEITNSKAMMKELEAVLARIQQAMETEKDFVQAVMERTQELLSNVRDIVQGNNETLTAVSTGQAPSMA